jgi:hypothetical protein
VMMIFMRSLNRPDQVRESMNLWGQEQRSGRRPCLPIGLFPETRHGGLLLRGTGSR